MSGPGASGPRSSGPRSTQRPYNSLFAKGAERKRQILVVAQRLLARNGWRNTTLAQIAKEAGVSTAGLLHHFESKEQLLHAVLEVRDADDDVHADRHGDVIQEIEHVAERFHRSPDMVGMFAMLLTENLDPAAPLHDRLLIRYRTAVDTVAEGIRRGQRDGRFRTDIAPAVKAVEVVAFINGMETSWLLDPSIPLKRVFKEYAHSLSRELMPANTP